MQLMTDIQCFLSGHKPALLFSYEHIMPYYSQFEIEQMRKYPYVSAIQQHRESNLYFQNEKLKERFLQKTIGIDHKSSEFIYHLGVALGYAPKAVEYYVDTYVRQIKSTSIKIGYDYDGIQFTSCADNLLEDVIWLWDQYTMKNMVIYYYKRWSFLRKGDYKQLLKIKEEVEKGAALATP